MAFDVFISYRWIEPDQTWVREHLAPALRSAGLRVCLDIEDFVPGRDLMREMTRAGTESLRAICVISPDYFDGNRMVGFESLMARRFDPSGSESKLVPLVIRSTDLPEWMRGLIPVDWTNERDHGREWRKLLDVLGAKKFDVPPPAFPSATLSAAAKREEWHLPAISANNLRHQRRILDAAVADEIPVGETREVLAMIRRETSPGLYELLRDSGADRLRMSWEESAYSAVKKDVRTTIFPIMFPTSNRTGGEENVNIQLEVRALGVDVADSPYRVKLDEHSDTPPVAFLIRSNTCGKQTIKVRVVCDDQDILPNFVLRTNFVQHGGPGGGSGAICHFETDESGRRVLVLAETRFVISFAEKAAPATHSATA